MRVIVEKMLNGSRRKMPKVIEVIVAETHRGSGTEEDPDKLITQLFTLEGVLICEFDGSRSSVYPIILRLQND